MKSLFYTVLFLLSAAGLTYSQQQDMFVAASGQNKVNLFSINLLNCANHFIDTLPLGMEGIACTPNGRLWGVNNDTTDAELYSIDTSTGNAALVGHFATHGGYVNSLAALNDSTLLFEAGGDLYGIVTTNIHSYLIGHIGYSSVGDLTWYGNYLYMAGVQGGSLNNALLIKITFNNSYTAINAAVPVSNMPNTSNCFGLATVVLPSMDTAIVGFADSSAYIVSPIDGSYQFFCSILPDSFSAADAASMLPPPLPTAIINPTGNKEVKIYPNPTNNQLFVNCNDPNAVLTLTDITGRTILQQPLTKSIQQVNITHIAAGMYIVTIRTVDKVIYRQKIVKE